MDKLPPLGCSHQDLMNSTGTAAMTCADQPLPLQISVVVKRNQLCGTSSTRQWIVAASLDRLTRLVFAKATPPGAPFLGGYRWAFVATVRGLFSEQKFNCPCRRSPYLQLVGGTPIQEIRTSRPINLEIQQ
ncbi:MAG TPA: hypothetical protein VNO32_57535 [Candidatus Acidoferrum sp.]|nr:hypothetical protein [Candidatus Acidoferrum sp.]